jgi:hypothetical protein
MTSLRCWLILSLFAASSGGLGCAEEVATTSSRAACEELRDHVIDVQIRIATEHGGGLDEDAREAHRRAMRTALGDEYLTRCAARTPEAVACALRAETPEAVDACAGEAP